MYTLTYKSAKSWQPKHISGFVRWLRDDGCLGYTWVAELQKRGAVHYHCLAVMPAGYFWRKPNKEHGGWVKGFTWVTPDIEKPFYIMKYLQKGATNGTYTKFPKGLRLYGISYRAMASLPDTERRAERLTLLPYWFRENETAGNVALVAHRMRGGIAVGSRYAVSPYSNSPLASVRELDYNMHKAWCSSPNHGEQ